MPQLLLEFFSEEIPARMQKRAEEDLARVLTEKLKAAGLEPKAIKTFSSPRRIGAVLDDLAAKAADVNEEKKGPRVGAPEQAIQGFLKSAGLTSIDQAQVVEDKKGAFYVAKIERAGRPTPEIVRETVPEIVRAFPWPKSMRSGSSEASARTALGMTSSGRPASSRSSTPRIHSRSSAMCSARLKRKGMKAPTSERPRPASRARIVGPSPK